MSFSLHRSTSLAFLLILLIYFTATNLVTHIYLHSCPALRTLDVVKNKVSQQQRDKDVHTQQTSQQGPQYQGLKAYAIMKKELGD